MRIAILALLLALSVSAVIESSQTCLTKNGFLGQMKTDHPHNVTIFEQVQSGPFQSCRSEWNVHGSCCKASDLIRMNEFETEVINSNNKKLIEVVKLFRKLILVRKGFNHEEKVKAKTIYVEFKVATEKCWSYMKKLRSSSFCSICSGRSEIYFYRQQNADISRRLRYFHQ